MKNDDIFSPVFWMYFSHVLSFVIPIFCGITLLIVKGAAPSKQAGMHPRYLLGLIFAFTGLLFIPNMIHEIHKYSNGMPGLPVFSITINLFLIPLYFFYFRKLTKPQRLTPWKVWFHLLPGTLVLVTGFLLFSLQGETPVQDSLLAPNPCLAIFRGACLVLQFGMIVTYTVRVLQLKRGHTQKLEDNYSSTENIDLHWLNQAIPIAVLFALIALFASCFQTIWSDNLFRFSSIIFVFYLFIHALNEPYIYYSPQHVENHEQEEVEDKNPCIETPEANIENDHEISPVFPPLPEKYLKNLGIKREKMKDDLIRLFDEKEIYTNGDLTINDVAALLGTNRTYISNLINNEFGFSFYQFVNKYRIQKATILLIERPDSQIQEIATLAGFNSLSSFISSFKLNEGITPKQWKQRYAL